MFCWWSGVGKLAYMNAATWVLVVVAPATTAAAPASHPQREQCKDPLFMTHWSGKNDIQTLWAYPIVKTNLKLCPQYNQRASCCHQTFESEQSKYFNFWQTMFLEKFRRVEAHRASVAAAGQAAHQTTTSRADLEQHQVALSLYSKVLSRDAQAGCFSKLLTYVAGMMCFSCSPEWFHYTVLVGDVLAGEQIVRVRMARSVCLELWDACQGFGRSVAAMTAALADSNIARSASRPQEDLSMFTNEQGLCDWMHDQVAMHPFRQPNNEDSNVPLSTPASSGLQGRRLEPRKMLNVLREGRQSGFSRRWEGTPYAVHIARGLAMSSER